MAVVVSAVQSGVGYSYEDVAIDLVENYLTDDQLDLLKNSYQQW